jgi:hypothetical protein
VQVDADVLRAATAAQMQPTSCAPGVGAGNETFSQQAREQFISSVLAVQEIVTRKLYRSRGLTLEDYFKTMFRLSRAQVYRVLDCAGLYTDFTYRFPTIPKQDLEPYPLKQRLCKTIRGLAPTPYLRQQVWAMTLKRFLHDSSPDQTKIAVDEITSRHVRSVWDDLNQTHERVKSIEESDSGISLESGGPFGSTQSLFGREESNFVELPNKPCINVAWNKCAKRIPLKPFIRSQDSGQFEQFPHPTVPPTPCVPAREPSDALEPSGPYLGIPLHSIHSTSDVGDFLSSPHSDLIISSPLMSERTPYDPCPLPGLSTGMKPCIKRASAHSLHSPMLSSSHSSLLTKRKFIEENLDDCHFVKKQRLGCPHSPLSTSKASPLLKELMQADEPERCGPPSPQSDILQTHDLPSTMDAEEVPYELLSLTVRGLRELARRGYTLQPKSGGLWLEQIERWRFVTSAPESIEAKLPHVFPETSATLPSMESDAGIGLNSIVTSPYDIPRTPPTPPPSSGSDTTLSSGVNSHRHHHHHHHRHGASTHPFVPRTASKSNLNSLPIY